MKISKVIKGKSKTFDVEVLASNFERSSSTPVEKTLRPSTPVSKAPKAAPVEDAPPAWTKRADLPDG